MAAYSVGQGLSVRERAITGPAAREPDAELTGVRFSLLAPETIRRLSAVQLTNASTFQQGRPTHGGVYDMRMGPQERGFRCPVCGDASCSGHYGHIELPEPVYNWNCRAYIEKVLRTVCHGCSRLATHDPESRKFKRALAETPDGGPERLKAIADAVYNKNKLEAGLKCEHCGATLPLVAVQKERLCIKRSYGTGARAGMSSAADMVRAVEPMVPAHVLAILRGIRQEDAELLGFLPPARPEYMMQTVVLVMPNAMRPAVRMTHGASKHGEDDRTTIYKEILRCSEKAGKAREGYEAAVRAEAAKPYWQSVMADVEDVTLEMLEQFYGATEAQRGEYMNAMGFLQMAVTALSNYALAAKANIAGKTIRDQLRSLNARSEPKDIRKVLAGKDGLIRGQMGGCRVDQGGRTVIGPAPPEFDVWHIGLPEKARRTLTKPVRLTAALLEARDMEWAEGWPVEEIPAGGICAYAAMVANGPEHPLGAHAVLKASGELLDLVGMAEHPTRRRAIALELEIGDVVERHVQEGDWVIFNRQPTVYKLSFGAHQVIAMEGNTTRLHRHACSKYNADFDGDEMNFHLLQTLPAEAEAQLLMDASFHIRNPQHGGAGLGGIQDDNVALYQLTAPSVLLTRGQVMQLLSVIRYAAKGERAAYAGMPHGAPLPKPKELVADHFGLQKNGSVPACVPGLLKAPRTRLLLECPFWDWLAAHELPEPAQLVPSPRWTGAQVFSLLLPADLQYEQGDVLVQDGELLQGRLDKKTVGMGGRTIAVAIAQDCGGPWAAARFLSDMGRLANAWLDMCSVTVGCSDCILPEDVRTAADAALQGVYAKVEAVDAIADRGGLPEVARETYKTVALQTALVDVGGVVGAHMAEAKPDSGLYVLPKCGAKGGPVNATQLSAVVGQQTVGSDRLQPMLCGLPRDVAPRTFFNRPHGTDNPRSRGFVSRSYAQGLRADEYMAHTITGRSCLIDTAVKTSEVGYIQRKITKAEENVVQAYDGTARNANGTVVEFTYNGDGYDSSLVQWVKLSWLGYGMERFFEHCFGSSRLPHASGVPPSTVLALWLAKKTLAAAHVRAAATEAATWRVRLPLDFLHLQRKLGRRHAHGRPSLLDWAADVEPRLLQTLYALGVDRGTAGSVEEALLQLEHGGLLRTALVLECMPVRLQRVWRVDAPGLEQLLAAVVEIHERAQVQPGEALGATSAGCIGQPTLQETLNTFHLCGAEDKGAASGTQAMKGMLDGVAEKGGALILARVPSADAAERLASNLREVILKTVLDSSRSCVISAEEFAQRPGAALDAALGLVPPAPACALRLTLNIQKMMAHQLDVLQVRRAVEQYLEAGWTAQWDKYMKQVLRGLTLPVVTCTPLTALPRWEVYCVFRTGEQRAVRRALAALQLQLSSGVLLSGVRGVYSAVPTQTKISVEQPDGSIADVLQDTVRVRTSEYSHVLRHPHVDARSTWCSDVQQVAAHLGVEAAVQTLVRRFRELLSGAVNDAHVRILADAMTFNGAPAALTRHHMSKLEAGILHRASFEASFETLVEASTFGLQDMVHGSTERIMVGMLPHMGTGMVEALSTQVLTPMQQSAQQSAHALAGRKRRSSDVLQEAEPVPENWKAVVQVLREALPDVLVLKLQFARLPVELATAMAIRLDAVQGWDRVPSLWHCITDVRYAHDGRYIHTVVEYPTRAQEDPLRRSHILKTQSTAAVVGVWAGAGSAAYLGTASTVRECNVPLQDIPSAVVPESVMIKHRRLWSWAGSWTITLTHRWSGPSMEAAEAAMAAEPGAWDIKLELVNPVRALTTKVNASTELYGQLDQLMQWLWGGAAWQLLQKLAASQNAC